MHIKILTTKKSFFENSLIYLLRVYTEVNDLESLKFLETFGREVIFGPNLPDYILYSFSACTEMDILLYNYGYCVQFKAHFIVCGVCWDMSVTETLP